MGLERTYTEPDGDVGVSWRSGAACVLLVSVRLYEDWVLECACSIYVSHLFPSSAAITTTLLYSVPLNKRGMFVPRRDASNGAMSKMSTPCIFPKISKRSKPVACSRSVGMVPDGAPGGRRSASLLISVHPIKTIHQPTSIVNLSNPRTLHRSLAAQLPIGAPYLQKSSTSCLRLLRWLV